jgi:signal transduction histidine kinase
MSLDRAFLRSKVAKRIFFLFVLCSMVPLAILAGITFASVNTQLTEQAKKRLRQNCKTVGLQIYNNLSFLDIEMQTATARVKRALLNGSPSVLNIGERILPDRFKSAVAVLEDGRKIDLLNEIRQIPALTPEEREHLNLGRAVLVTHQSTAVSSAIFMVRSLDPDHSGAGILVAEVDPGFLWGSEAEDLSPAESQMFVLQPEKGLLFSSVPESVLNKELIDSVNEFPATGSFEYRYKGQTFIAGYWSLFLKYHFLKPHWTVIISQSRSAVLEPVVHFKRLFYLTLLLTFFVVCLFSIIQIRKSLIPIEILRKGTEQIANGEFGIEVDIRSGDEFESLGRDFNEMSRKLKEGRAMLVQSAKMGAVGQMASGVVHEIGQPLTSISGLIDILGLDKTTDAGKRRLDLMKKEMERLTNIISRFKNFARVSEHTMKSLSLNEVVDATYALLEHQLKMKGLYCNIETKEGLPSILGDSNSLQQVFINLIINSMDALEGKKDEKPLVTVRTFIEEAKVCVEVKDNGSGIPKDIQEKIFDPFFTTKGPEKGTGLGLAIIASILHQHHASIALQSEVGKGTQFKVSFPAAS